MNLPTTDLPKPVRHAADRLAELEQKSPDATDARYQPENDRAELRKRTGAAAVAIMADEQVPGAAAVRRKAPYAG